MKKYTSLFLLVIVTIACNNNTATKTGTSSFSVTEKKIGIIDSSVITEYTITNPDGMQVSIMNYGGTVTQLFTKDKEGVFGDVILGYDSLTGFLQKGNPYFGCLVGRYANRIANGNFTIDGKTYQLAKNDNGQSLHGGIKGFDKVVWNVEKQQGDSSLKLTYLSKDGEEGYPGNVSISVVYTLRSDNALAISYEATTDKATPINLTNHCYFNLSAGKDSTILNHSLQLLADAYTPVNDVLIPLGTIDAVKNTPMDFRTPKKIGKDIAVVKGGYDHNWVLNKKDSSLTLAATLEHTASGRVMEVYTTEPGIQFYSGNFLDGTLQNTKKGAKYVKHAALCLETQHFPNSPNQSNFPSTILKPGAVYTHTSVYKFLVQ